MKRNESYILRKFAGECMLVPTGKATQDFNGMITLNETAEFVWNHIDEVTDLDQLVELMLEQYDAEPDVAKRDVEALVSEMIASGMVEE